MIRSILIVFLAMAIFIPAAVQAQESFESTVCVSATLNVIHMSDEILLSSFDLKGMVRSDSNSEFLNDVSEWCVGLTGKVGDKMSQRGYCKYVYPNGDINLGEWEGIGSDGTFKFIFGTGKWQGLKGEGTWNVIQRAKSVAPGTFQNCRKLKGTYELPK